MYRYRYIYTHICFRIKLIPEWVKREDTRLRRRGKEEESPCRCALQVGVEQVQVRALGHLRPFRDGKVQMGL